MSAAEQFGFASSLQTEPELATVLNDFLDDLALLIHLNRIHARVCSRVTVLAGCSDEGVVQSLQSVANNSVEPQQDRYGDTANLKAVHKIFQVN